VNVLVIVPTRGRRAQCERLLESFRETTADADILFVIDDDDEETYEGLDALTATISPRGSLVQKLNQVAMESLDAYDALMFAGDDHVFRTENWDVCMTETLGEMGGSGMVYPDDKRRNDIPELIMITSDVIRELGWFANPVLNHYYIDNTWGDLGKRSYLLRFCPEVVIEHLHYSVDRETEHDETYRYAEETWGPSDLRDFHAYRGAQLPNDIARLRRAFNPDVRWVLGKVLCGC
jgi:hypothetical protein